MTVYVDWLRRTPRTKAWPFNASCHLLADTDDELHAFAERIGMRRAWFQPGSTPHYDLTANRRLRAIALGAHPLCTREDLGAVLQRLREQRQRPA